jgi:hypothetical protein
MTTSATPLYRTATGDRLHIRECPHLVGKEVFIASDREVCDICARELRGEGRTYYADLSEGLRALGGPQGNWPLIVEHLAAVEHDSVWIPYSRSYIALGRDGRAVAWAGKTYVEPALGESVELPGFRAGSGGGTAVEEVWGPVCEVHRIERARNGSCWMCEN